MDSCPQVYSQRHGFQKMVSRKKTLWTIIIPRHRYGLTSEPKKKERREAEVPFEGCKPKRILRKKSI